MLSDDIWETLNMYYAWARANTPDNLLHPSATPFRRLLGSGIGSEGLSDDEAASIDKALGLLSQENGEAIRLLERVHADRKTLRWLESRGEGDRKRNARILSEAHQFVKGYIYGNKQ